MRKESKQIAENNYKSSDYSSGNNTKKGYAKTHEQVSDTYVEGTIGGKMAGDHK